MNAIAVCFCCIFLISTIAGQESKNALIVGASTGVGREVAKELAHHGYELGIYIRS